MPTASFDERHESIRETFLAGYNFINKLSEIPDAELSTVKNAHFYLRDKFLFRLELPEYIVYGGTIEFSPDANVRIKSHYRSATSLMFPQAFERSLVEFEGSRIWIRRRGANWIFDHRTPGRFFDLLLNEIKNLADKSPA